MQEVFTVKQKYFIYLVFSSMPTAADLDEPHQESISLDHTHSSQLHFR